MWGKMETIRRFFQLPEESFFLFGPLDSPSEIDGQALEGLVCQHLQAWISYTDTDIHLYFWRTRSGSERAYVQFRGSEFHTMNERFWQSQEQRRAKAQR